MADTGITQNTQDPLFYIVITPACFLYESPGLPDGANHSEVTDEIFSGWAVCRAEDSSGPQGAQVDGWIYIETHYGYSGYVRTGALRAITREQLEERQDRARFWLLEQAASDVLAAPRVQGECLETLYRGSIVEVLPDAQPGMQTDVYGANDTAGLQAPKVNGWTRIRTASGAVGYVHSHFLTRRMDDDSWLLYGHDESVNVSDHESNDTCGSLFNRNALRIIEEVGEPALRRRLTDTARSYLGTQYRWAGKSSLGIDCSGLVFMSCMMNGILPYRDAWIKENHPIREITREQLQAGDFIFFEGHVAMSLGGLSFIHATGFARDACVTINSLDPQDPLFREDLPARILWFGSLFEGEYTTKTREDEEAVLAARKNVCESGKAAVDRSQDTREGACLQGILERLKGLDGKISFFYRNLITGTQEAYNARVPMQGASVIKIYLMAAMFDGFDAGLLDPAETIRIPDTAKVPSCGVLNYLSDVKEMTLRDLIELMIIVSDNTATNLLWDLYEERFGEGSLNRFVRKKLELTGTSLNRKMFDAEKAAQGIENYTTAADAAWLLDALYHGTLVSEKASEEMLGMLRDQRLNGKIPFYLHTYNPVPLIAHKTGEDYRITHDVGLIEGDHPMILCFMGNDVDVPAFERLMAEAARMLYDSQRGRTRG